MQTATCVTLTLYVMVCYHPDYNPAVHMHLHLLIMQILYHYCQGPASPLHAYIQTLPGVQQGIPKPQIAMLYLKPQLQELQYNPLIGDAASQAYWWRQYSKEVLAALPGSADDPFGGQLVTQEQLGEAKLTISHVLPSACCGSCP